MEIRHLRYLLAVASSGSVTAAADVVHVTQPALSRQLRSLERALGFDLFHRGEKRLTLNAAGRQFLPAAQDLVSRFDRLERTAADIARGVMTSIEVRATETTTHDVLAPFVATWTQSDPIPTLGIDLPDRIYGALTSGADLAIGTERPNDEWDWIPLARLPVWAFVNRHHPLAGSGEIGLASLLEENLLVLSPDHQARRALDSAVFGARLAYARDLVELASAEVAQALVAAGRGVAALSDDPRFGLVPLEITNGSQRVSVRLYAAWDREHHAAGKLSTIAERLREFCIAAYGQDANFTTASESEHA